MKWKSQILAAHDLKEFTTGWLDEPRLESMFTLMIDEPTLQVWVRIELQRRPGDVLLWLFYDPEEE